MNQVPVFIDIPPPLNDKIIGENLSNESHRMEKIMDHNQNPNRSSWMSFKAKLTKKQNNKKIKIHASEIVKICI